MADPQANQSEPVTILVNESPVTMSDKKTTGKGIKEAAIQQGVKIQLDFVLSVELNDRRSKVVGDNDAVELHKHERFLAVAPDDNS
jgi:hypothetical protein